MYIHGGENQVKLNIHEQKPICGKYYLKVHIPAFEC